MRCKLIFHFDDYKGSAEVFVPGNPSLEELKTDKHLPEYVAKAQKSNLNYRTYQKKKDSRFQIDVFKKKDSCLTLDGSLRYTDLGSWLAKVKVLDADTEDRAIEQQLQLF